MKKFGIAVAFLFLTAGANGFADELHGNDTPGVAMHRTTSLHSEGAKGGANGKAESHSSSTSSSRARGGDRTGEHNRR